MAVVLKEPASEEPFAFIDPPFKFDAPNVANFAPEISGNLLLKRLCARLESPGLAGKQPLDFGCRVCFARTIINHAIDIGLYAGVDVNEECIAWLQSNVDRPNMSFYHFDKMNSVYRSNGKSRDAIVAPKTIAHGRYDAACMFSVITHQAPDDAKVIVLLPREAVRAGGQLYFTAFLDQPITEYGERVPDQPSAQCVHSPSLLCGLAESQGWKVVEVFKKSHFRQNGIRCLKN